MTRLDSVLQHVMKNDEPFGGVQVIITGDLYQLPPVKPFAQCLECGLTTRKCKGKPKEWECAEHGIYHDDDKWAFRSQPWDDLKLRCKQLVQIHRQSDPIFRDLLNEYRVGATLTSAEEAMLWDHDSKTDKDAIKTYPRRDTVNIINAMELEKLQELEYDLRCVDSHRWNEDKTDYQRYDLAKRWERVRLRDNLSPFMAFTVDRHRYDEIFHFKNGMPVVLSTNIHRQQDLVSGSQGKIVGFESYDTERLPRARRNSDEHHTLKQWIFFDDHGAYQEAEVNKFCDRALPTQRIWPVVKFQNGIICTIYPYCEVHEIGSEEPYSLTSRTQIPLLAAWAITTHKSQGMTLGQAEIDMSDAWEHGQIHTAMSRVRSLEGLKVTGLTDGQASRADGTVHQFMQETAWIEGAG